MNSTPVEKLKQLRDYVDRQHKIEKNVILKKVKDLFVEVNYQKNPFDYKIPALYRAVISENESWFDHIDKFGITPSQFARLSRCNWPNKPAFYCSNDNSVPIFECRAKDRIGHFLTRSTWIDNSNYTGEIVNPIVFRGITLGVEQIVDNLKEEEDFRNLLLKDDIFKPSTSALIKDFDRAIGQMFRESGCDNLYWITSAITKIYLTQLDGLIYPSVESNETGTNTVFTKDFYHDNLQLWGAAMYQIIGYDEATKEYELLPIKSLCKYITETGPDFKKPMWKKVHSRHAGETWKLSTSSPIIPWLNDESQNLTLEEVCL